MASRNFNHLKTPIRLHKSNSQSQNFELINPLKKTKNTFRNFQNLRQRNNFVFYRPNLYRSFIYSSAPFNYYRNPEDKNSFLVCFNGGPKKLINSFIKRQDLNNENNNNKETIYNSIKPCGCLSKQIKPKLSRNVSYDNLRYYNNMSSNKNQFNTFNKINNLPKNPLSRNKRSFSGLLTSKSYRRSNDGKHIYLLKKFIEGNNIEENKNEENNDANNLDNINRYGYSACYGFRPKMNKRFHKTQIFDHCKPFLCDEFQEFPD